MRQIWSTLPELVVWSRTTKVQLFPSDLEQNSSSNVLFPAFMQLWCSLRGVCVRLLKGGRPHRPDPGSRDKVTPCCRIWGRPDRTAAVEPLLVPVRLTIQKHVCSESGAEAASSRRGGAQTRPWPPGRGGSGTELFRLLMTNPEEQLSEHCSITKHCFPEIT